MKFTKAGIYKYFCNVHPGMVGFVVVKPKGQKIPTAKQDAATLNAAETAYRHRGRRASTRRRRPETTSASGASGAGRRRGVRDVPLHADGQGRHDGDVLDLEAVA